MSFVKTLATLAVGFAAAKGVEKFRTMGGMEGVKDALAKAGEPGGVGDQMGAMAEKMGVPNGREAVRGMMEKFGTSAVAATGQAEAGLGSLMTAMTGAAAAGAKNMGGLMEALTGATPAGAMAEENARLMIRAMIQAAKADGQIDAAEREVILSHLSDASDEEIAFVEAEFDAALDPVALAQGVADTARAQVYSTSLMVLQVDTEAERVYLRNLAAALHLDAETVAQLHAQMGKPLA
ncbi:MAG: DUF533 domain-containing protein [Rhodobacteraceae bacterium]|nr:DUF533 domain-containing protein [Paracoccaceae bacterium]